MSAYNTLGHVFASYAPVSENKIPVLRTLCAGRPTYDIPCELLLFFLEAGFPQKDTASILSVSENSCKKDYRVRYMKRT